MIRNLIDRLNSRARKRGRSTLAAASRARMKKKLLLETLEDRRLLAGVFGYKFEDLNGDGVEDPGEPRLNGVQFSLDDGINPPVFATSADFDLDGGGSIDPATESGLIRFTGLAAGTYTLTEVPAAGFVQTTLDPAPIMLAQDEAAVAIAGLSGTLGLTELTPDPLLAVGNYVEGSIHGFKFEDVDGDEVFTQGTDLPLANVGFELSGTDGQGNAVFRQVITDVSGGFDFVGLPPGVYTVIEFVPPGFVPTTPVGITTPLLSREELVFEDGAANLQPGDPQMEDNLGPFLMFGNTVYGSIHGFKFEDVDGDGVYTQGTDTPQGGVEFTLTGTDGQGNVINLVEFSDPTTGEFWFTDLVPSVNGQGPGTGYTVTETVPTGFTSTTLPITRTFDLESRDELVWMTGAAMLPPAPTPAVDQQQLMTDASLTSFGTDFTAQSFVPNVSGQLTQVDLSVTATAPVGEVILEVQTLDLTTGEPSGTVVGSVTIPAGTVPTGANQALSFDFSAGPPTRLIGGFSYALVLRSPMTVALSDFSWDFQTAGNPYLNGTSLQSADSGATWFFLPDADQVFTTTIQPDPDPRMEFLVDSDANGTGDELMFGNTVPGSIHGVKFIDTNRNQIYDQLTEVSQPNVTFTLTGTDGLGNAVNMTAMSGPNGEFEFTGLQPSVAGVGQGTGYTLTETVPAGFNPSGQNPRTFDLLSRQELVWQTGAANLAAGALQQEVGVDLMLGNFEPAEIHGYKFDDRNNNGVEDPGEPRLNGVFMFLDLNNNMIFDDFSGFPFFDTVSITADRDLDGDGTIDPATERGLYSFLGLPAGTYTVRELVTPPETVTTPAIGSVTVTVAAGESAVAVAGLTVTPGLTELAPESGLIFGDHLPGQIHGYKFNDLNADGVQDPGELPLANWTIELRDINNALVDTQMTNTNGEFWFTDLIAGTYFVREVQQPGWVQTSTNTGALVVTRGQVYVATSGLGMLEPDDIRFELIKHSLAIGNTLTSSIHGFKFDDLNRNGVFDDPPETPIPGVTFTLTTPTGGQVHDAAGNVVGPQVTAADGRFGFTNLLAGTYLITEIVPANRQSTTAPIAREFTVARGEELVAFAGQAGLGANDDRMEMLVTTNGSDLQWGNAPQLGAIHGHKFTDINGNGIEDTGDPRTNGFTITLTDLAGNPVMDAFGNVIPAMVTSTMDVNGDGNMTPDEIGHYWFEDLLPGTYLVRETQTPGFQQTTHDPQPITITGGEVYVGQSGQGMLLPDDPRTEIVDKCLIFGNTLTASIHGFKYNDLDRDGVADGGEPALAGVTFTLTTAAGAPVMDAAGNIVGPRVTDANGFFGFTNLLPGTYIVTETVPSGQQSTTKPIAKTFTITAGQELVARLSQAGLQPGDARTEVNRGAALEWGNAPELGEIHGHKFEDIDGDGVQDPGEPRLNGWTITLTDLAGNQVTDAFGNIVQPVVTAAMDVDGDGTTSATETGLYWFTNLLPGTYIIRETLQAGFAQTTKDPQPIAITGGQVYVAQHDQVMLADDDARTIIVDKWLGFGNQVRGDLTWVKRDKHGDLLGGVIFALTRTHSFDQVTQQFTNIVDEPINVTDNLAPDVDTDFGEFRVEGLLLGRYTLAESVPVPGYDPDTFIESFDITDTNNSHTASHIWVNTWSKRAFVGSTFALRLAYLAELGLSEPQLNAQPAAAANGVQPAAEGPPIAEQPQAAIPEAEGVPIVPEAVAAEAAPQVAATQNEGAEGEGVLDQNPWQNALNRYDVDGDGIVTPRDVLICVNWLNSQLDNGGSLSESGAPYYYDVSGDGQLTALDVLHIANQLESFIEAEGEGAPLDPNSEGSARDKVMADYDTAAAIVQTDEMIAGVAATARAPESPTSRYHGAATADDGDDDLESLLSVLVT